MLRNPDTIPAGDTIIQDPAMEPLFITKSSAIGGFTVYERVNRGKDEKSYLRTVCYPSSFNSALKTVAKELLNHSEKKQYNTVKEYIQSWNEIEEKMKTITMVD
jgi:hypothetical protein